MRITNYKTELSEWNIPILVKESSYNYAIDRKALDNPSVIAKLFSDLYKLEKQTEEYTYMMCFNTKMHLIGIFKTGHGTVSNSLVGMRELAVKSLLVGAVNIVFIHNHPSGDPVPSNDDLQISKKLKAGFELIGMNLVDMIICGNTYYSFKEHNLL